MNRTRTAPPAIRYPRGRDASAIVANPALAPLLIPASWVFQVVSASVRAVRSVDAPVRSRGALVVSVGNIEVGGSGKTPMAIHLLASLAQRGARVGYVSRGYRSRASRLPLVTGLAGDDAPPLRGGVRWLSREHPDLAAEVGDEPALVAERVRQAAVFAGADKRAALACIEACGAADVVVLDDAFQSWTVYRDLDIVMLDGNSPFGNGRTLPAGPLREEPEALARADFIGFNGVDNVAQLEKLSDEVKRSARGDHRFFAVHARPDLVTGDGTGEHVVASLDDARVATVSGIARPASFDAVVGRMGSAPVLSVRYPDHHAYTRSDVTELEQEFARADIHRVVTTEKDWVKLRHYFAEDTRFVRIRLQTSFLGDDPAAEVARRWRAR